MENDKLHLKPQWNAVGKIILSPGASFLIVLISSLILIIYFAEAKINSGILTLLVVVLSLLSGLLGGFITKRISNLSKEQSLRDRGYASIRNLNLLLSHIFSIKKRVGTYIRSLNHEEFNYELLRSHFEEISEKCNNLFEDVANAIENWQDVISEANLRMQISTVFELKKEIEQRLGDLTELRKLSDRMDKEMNENDRGRLKLTLEKMEVTLVKLEDELKKQESKVLIDKQLYVFEDGRLFFAESTKNESLEERIRQFKPNNLMIKTGLEDVKIP